ncbi:MAG: B12-binding domain-containing radical SAM protein, partial [Candidatus Hodarchaeota archaeon]
MSTNIAMPLFLKEKNVEKKKSQYRFGFFFPSTYDVGMGGMTTSVLTQIINQVPDWSCERFFVPWNPNLETTSMESVASLKEVDVIGFTSQFELQYLAVVWFLQKANIPLNNLTRSQQAGKYPLIVVGGPCTMANPLPLIDLVDGYFLGDAEQSLPLFLSKLTEKGVDQFWKDPLDFTEIEGFWSPYFLNNGSETQIQHPYSEYLRTNNFEDVAGIWYKKFHFVDLNDITYPLKQIIALLPDYHPYAPIKGNTFQLEIGRGCSHRCKFCMISRLLKKGRYRDYSQLIDIALEGTTQTGVVKVDLFGTNLSDYPRLADLCWELINNNLKVSIATFRPDAITNDLMEAVVKGGQTSITIAPETGSDELRRKIGKPLTNEQILQATEIAFAGGVERLKNFFLVGLPSETNEDRNQILTLVHKQRNIALQFGEDNRIRADVNPVVPKWHTPMKDWVYYYLPENRATLKKILMRLYHGLSNMAATKAKTIIFSEFVAQTWLTHLIKPVGILIKKESPQSHIPMTLNSLFYLQEFTNYFDSLLTSMWENFKENHWKISHLIHGTTISDEKL